MVWELFERSGCGCNSLVRQWQGEVGETHAKRHKTELKV